LRPRPVGLADDLEPFATLAAADRAEPVVFRRLEDGRPPPLRRAGRPSLEATVAPRDDELGALGPPAPEERRDLRRRGRRTRPPRLRLRRVDRGRDEVERERPDVEARRRVRERDGADTSLRL